MHPPRIEQNGRYWRARWYDALGRRRSRNLGERSTMGKREAQAALARLTATLVTVPGARDAGRAPTLAAWLELHEGLRAATVASGTLQLDRDTGAHLLAHFGPSLRLDRLRKGHAEDWCRSLAVTMADVTVAGHLRRARAMLSRAVDRGLLAENPWKSAKWHAPTPEKDWPLPSSEDIARVLEAAGCPSWRCLVGLCAYAGLRLGEALALEWDGVRFGERRIVAPQPKTAKSRGRTWRVVLMEDGLESLLVDAHGLAKGARVVELSRNNLHRDMTALVRRAGVAPWPDPFQTLRRWRASTWAMAYPARVVDEWLGHSAKVATRHYFKVPDEMYGANCPNPAPNQSANRV